MSEVIGVAPYTVDTSVNQETVRVQGIYKLVCRAGKEATPGMAYETRGLFIVYVVDPEQGVVIHSQTVVADDADRARLKALIGFTAIDYDTVDIIVVRLGDVRPRRPRKG